MITVGCCGYPVARKKYYSRFPAVEIQTTFYNPPDSKVAERWRAEAPKGFEFVVKAWQLITHSPQSPTYEKAGLEIPDGKVKHYGLFRPTQEVFKAWEETEQIASVLGSKVIIFQSPSTFLPTRENMKNMKDFFNGIDRKDYVFAWESRGKWKDERVREVCSESNLVDCVDPLKRAPTIGEPAYFRLHGKGGHEYAYPQRELQEIVGMVGELKQGFVMFNNVYMFEDCLRFLQLLK
jgi:uncharacterized protein YecE (DUF72 family)